MAVAEKQYTTISGVPIEPLYGPEQLLPMRICAR